MYAYINIIIDSFQDLMFLFSLMYDSLASFICVVIYIVCDDIKKEGFYIKYVSV